MRTFDLMAAANFVAHRLPGLYSLDAASLDEQIARDVLTGRMAGTLAQHVRGGSGKSGVC